MTIIEIDDTKETPIMTYLLNFKNSKLLNKKYCNKFDCVHNVFFFINNLEFIMQEKKQSVRFQKIYFFE